VRDAFIKSLIELAEKDERIALLTGDLGFGVVEKFADKFPDRFWNCGVAEQSMMSIAAGLAKSGMRPYVYSIANFPTFRCLEQIRNDVCYHDLPVTIVSVGGGLGYGTLGYTHHGIEDIAAMRALPNISIYSPSDPNETNQVLTQSHKNGKPAYIRLGKNGEPNISANSSNEIAGSVRELTSGTDLTILASGAIAENCTQAAKSLSADHSIQVISIPRIQPLEVEFLRDLITSQKILVVEEHVERGGLAASILENFNKAKVELRFEHLFVKEFQITQIGSQDYLRSLSGLDVLNLIATCKEMLSES
jgi:transketolase